MTAPLRIHADLGGLLHQFSVAVPERSPDTLRRLRSICAAWTTCFPEESMLAHTHTTDWVAPWQAFTGHRRKTVLNQLVACNQWWTWLFRQRIIESNILAVLSPTDLATGRYPVLTLPAQWHLALEKFLAALPWRQPTIDDLAPYLWEFLRAVAARHTVEGALVGTWMDEAFIRDWFHQVTQHYGTTTWYGRMRLAELFCQHLCIRNLLPDNPVANLLRQFSQARRVGVFRALAMPDPVTALESVRRAPRFPSALAPQAEGFLTLQRQMGRAYQRAEQTLSQFDRYAAQHPWAADTPMTTDFIEAYLTAHPHWNPSTVQCTLVVLRKFCWYLHRYGMLTAIPDLSLLCPPMDQASPMTLSSTEVRELLAAVDAVFTCPRWPLKPHTVKAVLALLYGTGLRLSEALHLTVDAVDLSRALIVIHRTKFNKTRLVPLHASLATLLQAYAQQREAFMGPPRAGSPFFPSLRGGPYQNVTLQQAFKRLRQHLGWVDTVEGRPLCLHSLRHSFAHERVLCWYREDADVQNKLPLLSTYMGHVDLASTQVYLQHIESIYDAAMARFATYGSDLLAKENGDDDAHV